VITQQQDRGSAVQELRQRRAFAVLVGEACDEREHGGQMLIEADVLQRIEICRAASAACKYNEHRNDLQRAGYHGTASFVALRSASSCIARSMGICTAPFWRSIQR